MTNNIGSATLILLATETAESPLFCVVIAIKLKTVINSIPNNIAPKIQSCPSVSSTENVRSKPK